MKAAAEGNELKNPPTVSSVKLPVFFVTHGLKRLYYEISVLLIAEEWGADTPLYFGISHKANKLPRKDLLTSLLLISRMVLGKDYVSSPHNVSYQSTKNGFLHLLCASDLIPPCNGKVTQPSSPGKERNKTPTYADLQQADGLAELVHAAKLPAREDPPSLWLSNPFTRFLPD